jgi:hypothetical protein
MMICYLVGHKVTGKDKSGWQNPLVRWVTCERCGARSPELFEFKHGILNSLPCRLWFRICRIAFCLRCDFQRWRERNDPPPF